VTGLHLITHLARGGWLRWREEMPSQPARPGKGPLAFRLRFTDGAGFDLTEAGTRKRLAVYLVTDPAAVPGIASLGPDPLAPEFTADVLGGLLAGRRTQIKGVLRDQKIIAGIGNAYSDEVLHAARMSPFRLASSLSAAEVAALHDVIVGTLRSAVERSAGLAASELKKEKKSGLAVHGRTGEKCPVCGDVIRRSVVRRLGAAVLRDVPDGREAARRPPPVEIAEVGRAGPTSSSSPVARCIKQSRDAHQRRRYT